MGQGRRPRLIALAALGVLGACGGGDDGGGSGPPDGYVEVFSDDFSAGLGKWTVSAEYHLDETTGRPAPGLAGAAARGDAAQVTMTVTSGGPTILGADFKLPNPPLGAQVNLTLQSVPGFALSSNTAGTIEIDCPAANIVIAGGYDPDAFHHLDVRVDETGQQLLVDGVERCPKDGEQLTASYRIAFDLEAGTAQPVILDNVKLYNKP